MVPLRALLLTLAVVLAPASAPAQSDDGTVLSRFLESRLSGAGREVRISGFEGALSSQARLAEMTISDAGGVWLTLRGAVLDWNRAALLAGRLDVTRLSAEALVIARLPDRTPDSLPAPEAAAPGTGFTLPDLPVSIAIDMLAIDRIDLGAALMGEAVSLSLSGGLTLAGGSGTARITTTGRDGLAARLALEAGFDAESRVLSLDLAAEDAAGGLLSRRLGLPGAPAVALTVAGTGPVDDLTVDIALATDGADRLAGAVTLNRPAPDAPLAFAAELAGDLRPMVTADLRPFFGPDTTLAAAGSRAPDGATTLDRLTIRTDRLRLDGDARLAADGVPERFALTGQLAAPDGTPVRLPVPGPALRLAGADLSLGFDAAEVESWSLTAVARSVDRDGTRIDRLELGGGGTIGRGASGPEISADLSLAATGLSGLSPETAPLLGDRLDARLRATWQAGGPLDITALRLATAAGQAEGALTVATGTPLRLDGQLALRLPALARAAPLAARPLAGALDLTLTGTARPLDGAFDLTVDAAGTDLALGEARLDPLLTGPATLTGRLRRDSDGLGLQDARLRATGVEGKADLRLASTSGRLTLDARLPDLARLDPGLSGPARLVTTADSADGRDWSYALTASAAGAELDLDGTATAPVRRPLESFAATGSLRLSVPDLAPLGALAGRSLGGRIMAEGTFDGDLPAQRLALTLDAEAATLTTGLAEADALLAGSPALRLDASLSGRSLTVTTARLTGARATVSAQGTLTPDSGAIALEGRIADLSVLSDDLSGPLTLTARATPRGTDSVALTLDATGPAGLEARVSGAARTDLSRADLRITGAFPLIALNRRLAPSTLTGRALVDLSLNGPPRLGSLSGDLRLSGAGLAAPAAGLRLPTITGGLRLAGPQARLDLTAGDAAGGRATLTGTLGLSPGLPGALRLDLAGLGIARAPLIETTFDGALGLDGPLTGGARIAGDLRLGPTEIRIPETLSGSAGSVPEITHVGDSPAAARTRTNAGITPPGAARGAQAPPYTLDLAVRAPNRIFLRGRGLDAELGGALRLGGTTRDPVPTGQFDLIRGRLDILGKRLTLTEGFARLQGGLDPQIGLTATTTSAGTDIAVILEGAASAPDLRLSASPDMPEDEILARLLFGRGLDRISPLQAAQLAAAVATLAGRGGDGIVGNLRQSFGLADLDVTTDPEGGTAVRAGRYISENVYSDVTVSKGRTELRLNLDLGPGVTARGSAASDGETGIGLFFERDY
jgi:translocation and assembly module TamB